VTPADVAVVILAFNEAPNIAHAVGSVRGWAREVFVLDSFSTDDTVARAERAGATVFRHPFVDYASQRDHALTALPIAAEWVLFLDADEWTPPALRDEIAAVVAASPVENGFAMRYRLIWNGTWIRRGYYPTWILRLVRRGRARCDARPVGEHLLVDGAVGRLRADLMHEDRKGIDAWIAKHTAYASGEARELLVRRTQSAYVGARLFGTQAQRKRWLRERLWTRLPPLVRPFLYFFLRYIVQGGFLDGRDALVYHFLHALWYQLLIDVKYLEMLRESRQPAPRSDTAPSSAPSSAVTVTTTGAP